MLSAAERLPQAYYALERLGFETGAFAQLTQKYATEKFNPTTPDIEDVRYVYSDDDDTGRSTRHRTERLQILLVRSSHEPQHMVRLPFISSDPQRNRRIQRRACQRCQ